MSLYGRTQFDTASRVSATLRVTPTLAREADGPHPLPRFAAEGQIAASSSWTFDEGESAPTEDDPFGLASLDRLAERFSERVDAFAMLAEHYDIRVWLVVEADRELGGFVVRPPTLERLVRMRAALYPVVRVARPRVAVHA